MGDAMPPVSRTRNRPPAMLPTMMSPSRFHEPPTATPGRSHKVCGGPPDTSSFLSFRRHPTRRTDYRGTRTAEAGFRWPPNREEPGPPATPCADPEPRDAIRSAGHEHQLTTVWRQGEISRPAESHGRGNLEARRAGHGRSLAEVLILSGARATNTRRCAPAEPHGQYVDDGRRASTRRRDRHALQRERQIGGRLESSRTDSSRGSGRRSARGRAGLEKRPSRAPADPR